jgi:hypothetical protein
MRNNRCAVNKSCARRRHLSGKNAGHGKIITPRFPGVSLNLSGKSFFFFTHLPEERYVEGNLEIHSGARAREKTPSCRARAGKETP